MITKSRHTELTTENKNDVWYSFRYKILSFLFRMIMRITCYAWKQSTSIKCTHWELLKMRISNFKTLWFRLKNDIISKLAKASVNFINNKLNYNIVFYLGKRKQISWSYLSFILDFGHYQKYESDISETELNLSQIKNIYNQLKSNGVDLVINTKEDSTTFCDVDWTIDK